MSPRGFICTNTPARTAAAYSIVVAALAAGCAHKSLPPPEVPPPPPVSQTTTTSAPVAAPKADINVSEELIRLCNINLANVQTAPKFDFDRSEVRTDAQSTLDQVAHCVTVGPLRGRHLRLTGRADPRGEQEYNMTLGSSRAESVAGYLESLGVSDDQITETSRGKLDATGTDEAGWQIDRRVDIQ